MKAQQQLNKSKKAIQMIKTLDEIGVPEKLSWRRNSHGAIYCLVDEMVKQSGLRDDVRVVISNVDFSPS